MNASAFANIYIYMFYTIWERERKAKERKSRGRLTIAPRTVRFHSNDTPEKEVDLPQSVSWSGSIVAWCGQWRRNSWWILFGLNMFSHHNLSSHSLVHLRVISG